MTTLDPVVGDEIFESIVESYDAVPADEAPAFMARLCLLLALAVGDSAVVGKIVVQARAALTAPTPDH